MFNNQRMVVLCDMDSIIDHETGDRKRIVVNAKKIIGTENLVGVQTQQLAQLQNMNFNYSIVIDRMYYREQKYLYMNNKLYKIASISPARLPKDCKLNISIFQDKDIIKAIEEWLKNDCIC